MSAPPTSTVRYFDDAFLILQHTSGVPSDNFGTVHSTQSAFKQAATENRCSARLSSSHRNETCSTAMRGVDTKRLPYYQLLYLAFMSSETKRLYLTDIYKWFKKNTDKTQRGGWQNSIRHNLSMNQVCGCLLAFIKAEPQEGQPKSIRFTEWVMQDWAVIYGVRSTTSYRDGNARGSTSHIAKHLKENPHGVSEIDDTTTCMEIFDPVTEACDCYSIVAFENCLYPIPV